MTTNTGRAAVTGKLGYLMPTDRRPRNYMHPPPAGVPWENCAYEQRACTIHDGRRVASSLALEWNGFELAAAPHAAIDDADAGRLDSRDARALEALALTLTGGRSAVVFDRLVRRRDARRPTASFGRDSDAAAPSAVGRVHNDYSERSGRRRFGMVLPDAPDDAPFMILNFWQPLHHPALDAPLALCDTRSFAARDWVEGDIVYPDRTGEIYLARYSEAHHWVYFPAMTPEEMLVFKTYDSRLDLPARMTAHCAFDDPSAPPDAPPRHSVETRCLVVLD